MQKTIKNKTYTLKDGIWYGVDKNGKEFKVTVKNLLAELNKVEDNPIVQIIQNLKPEILEVKDETLLEGEWVDLSNVKPPISGLGDVIATVTETFGIKPCEACEERKKKLNKLFPFYKKDFRDLTDDEVELIKKATAKENMIEGKYIKPIFKLYNDLFNQKLEVCRCPGLLSKITKRLKDYANTITEE